MAYRNEILTRYFDDLAAKKPAPGGGSAAAVAGALGASLAGMVAQYTIGKKGYEMIQTVMRDIADEAASLRGLFLELADMDADVYDRLSRLARQNASGDEIGRARTEAAEVPLRICRAAGECMKLCMRLLKRGNKELVSDTAIAALMSESSFRAAEYNVLINLPYLPESRFKKNARARLSAIGAAMRESRCAVTAGAGKIMKV